MSMISELVEELIDNADLYTKELHDLMYRAANTIEMLSEKAREPKWIPCEERLPEDDEMMLVTVTNWDIDKVWVEVDNYDFEGHDGWWSYHDRVIAWMPLPPSYKGD